LFMFLWFDVLQSNALPEIQRMRWGGSTSFVFVSHCVLLLQLWCMVKTPRAHMWVSWFAASLNNVCINDNAFWCSSRFLCQKICWTHMHTYMHTHTCTHLQHETERHTLADKTDTTKIANKTEHNAQYNTYVWSFKLCRSAVDLVY
jgi:hypothetical protein